MALFHTGRLREALERKKILIAAHRGTCGGNIIPNTAGACENALLHGADIVELDAAMTTDGDFFAFHDGAEPVALGTEKNIRAMTTAELGSHPLLNSLGQPSRASASRLADVLSFLKGRCLVNIDRSWFYWPAVFRELERADMDDQIIIKSPPDPALLAELARHAPRMMYMPICVSMDDVRAALDAPVNTVAAELIFTSEEDELIGDDTLRRMRDRGWTLWVNAITLSDDLTLSARRDDDRAVLDSMDESWGWLIRKGFGIIQTDWPMLLDKYLRENHR